MKKILVLSSSVADKKLLFKKLVNEYLNKKGIDLLSSGYFDIFIDFNSGDIKLIINGKNITDFGLIYFRRVGASYSGLASAVAIIARKYGVNVIDKSWMEIGPMGDKLTSFTKLCLAGISIPRTIYFSNPKRINKFSLLKHELGTPFVAKDLQSQRGKGVFLVKSETDFKRLKNIYPGMKTNQFMFQSYIKKDHEYRLLVLGNKVKVWEEKIAQKQDEFRNNVALGASEVFLKINELPESYSEIAVKSASVLNMQVAGVDLMREKGTNRPFLLEVNRGPGFTYDQKESPEIEKISEYMGNIIMSKND